MHTVQIISIESTVFCTLFYICQCNVTQLSRNEDVKTSSNTTNTLPRLIMYSLFQSLISRCEHHITRGNPIKAVTPNPILKTMATLSPSFMLSLIYRDYVCCVILFRCHDNFNETDQYRTD